MKKVILAGFFIAFLASFSIGGYAETAEAVTQAATQEIQASPVQVPAIATPEVKTEIKSTKTVKFIDVPDDHWAASSVYDLVNLGVTQGYPDGTYRGNKNITRYETAMFLSKLAVALGEQSDETDIAVEKMKDELRAEIRTLRADISELKRMPTEGQDRPITGSYTTKILLGNVVAGNTSVEGVTAPNGPIVRYRLKTTFARNIGESAKLKINIDTMDSGFGGGGSDLSTKIFDIEGNMQLNVGLENPVNVKITSGPGPVVHTEEADANGNYIARSENNTVYVRPWNSVMFSSNVFGLDMGLGYIARKVNAFGEVEVNQLASYILYDFPGLFFVPGFKLNTNIDYLASKPNSDPAGPTDTKVTLTTVFAPSQKHRASISYGFGQGIAPHNTMFGLEFDLLDTWDTGTYISFKYKKVGSEYLYENATLNEDLFTGLDVFDKYIGNGGGLGVVDAGGEITQVINENIKLLSRFDWRLAADNSYGPDFPQCGLTLDAGVDWDIATDTLLEAIYRVESIPSASDQSTDLAQLSLSFKF